MDYQLILNITFGILGTVGGWFFKIAYDQIKELQEEVSDLEDKHDSDHRLITDRLNNLALSIPEKYVSKGDYDNLVKVVHHRFDRLEEKIDALKN
jgi:hypothetical protein